MKKLTTIMLTAMMVFLATAVVVTAQEVDVRGTVTNVGVNQFTWDNSSFAGLYYDIDKNLGNETITFSLTDATPTGATLTDQEVNGAPRGVVYKTQAQLKTFKYKPWGKYDVIGFLADKYFAAYNPEVTADVTNAGAKVAYLYDASKNRNLMTNEQISKVLVDDNTEQTITSSNPLKLQEGYQLAIKSVDVKGNKAYLELSKNGQVVDSKVVQPSIDNAKMSDQTYYYKTALGATSDIIQIAVHFKNAFAGTDNNIATVDGEFQVSDTVMPLKSEQTYDKMSIRTVDATGMSVIMDNKDNQITLSKNKDVVLMQNVHIKTADQDGTADAPLRYYVYKKITDAGSYQLRGTVANVMQNQVTWDNSSFSGFYYDIDKNLGAETLTFRPTSSTPTGATLSDQTDANNNRGVVYKTTAQLKKFKYKAWGQYNVIGFLANKYFAAYDPTVTAEVAAINESVAYLYDASKNRNLMTNEQISQVLVDDNKEQTITSANPLVLQNGYQLAIKSIDVDGNKAYIELTKNGQVVDDKVVQPSIANAMMKDQTYYYKASLGDTTDIIQIAVHFKNAFRGADTNIATVDGEFQIADTATALKTDLQYDKMSIRNVDATGMAVTMDNKDNQITLSKNKDVVLMQDVHIKTADQDGTDVAPLRYYIYKAATITAANATAANATAPAPAAAPAANVTTTPAQAGSVVQALNSAGNLKQFATALQAAGLVGWLDGQTGPFTIFAPNDDAFAAVPASSLNYLMANNQSDLKKLLTVHIIEKTDVINMTAPGKVKTNEGDSLNVDLQSKTVNGAKILSSMRYNTGIIYVIDRVLLPSDTGFLNKYGFATPATSATSAAANATQAPAPAPAATKTPGFEGIFAITGLMAVAYLVLGRRQ